MPPPRANSDIEERRQLIAQNTLELDAITCRGRRIGAERQVMSVESFLPDPRIGSLGGELQSRREPDVYDAAGAERVPSVVFRHDQHPGTNSAGRKNAPHGAGAGIGDLRAAEGVYFLVPVMIANESPQSAPALKSLARGCRRTNNRHQCFRTGGVPLVSLIVLEYGDTAGGKSSS